MKLRNLIASLSLVVFFTACSDDPAAKAPNGEACEVADDCESNECWEELYGCHFLFGCSSYELTGGMCSNECEFVTEGTDAERLQANCAEGEQCLVYASSPKICFQGCEFEEDCREDYRCTDMGDFKTCLPPEDTSRIIEDKIKIESSLGETVVKR